MIRSYIGLLEEFFRHFNRFLKENCDYEYLTGLGIEEPEDLLRSENAQRAITDVWNRYLESGRFRGLAIYDRILAEEAAMSGAVDWSYLRQLPTEPEYDEEQHETSKIRANQVRSSDVNAYRVRKEDSTKGINKTGKELDNRHPELNLLRADCDVVQEIIALARRQMSERHFYNDFVPGVYEVILGRFVFQRKRRYFAVAEYSHLRALGLEEPEDIFTAEAFGSALTDLRDFYFKDSDPIGPYTLRADIVDQACRRFGLIGNADRKRMRH
jgi:hypothetical protein